MKSINLKKKKVLISINTAWNFVNFRSGLIRALVAEGYDVVAVAPYDQYSSRVTELGCRFVSLPMDNKGTHPGRDLLLFWRFLRLLIRERPNMFLGFTVKPNIYGSLAARLLAIPIVNNIAGLGAVFGKSGVLLRLVQFLYRIALRGSSKVFFQNNDDRQHFIETRLVKAEVTGLLPGSGINLEKFCVLPLPTLTNIDRKFRFLLIARMLWDKGIGEFAQAASLLQGRWPNVEWCLLGFLDVQNPGAISRSQMQSLEVNGVIYLGVSDDVRVEIAEADCVVLPSYYREGTPRTLLEAASMGRPIITTDSVGCREVVDDGVNGFLCKVRDASNLAEKMEQMLLLSTDQRYEMGLKGRKKMESEFDENLVINEYLSALKVIN